jgi:hypothetical protein
MGKSSKEGNKILSPLYQNLIPIAAGLGVGITFLIIFIFFSPYVSHKESVCGNSIENVKASTPFTILLPTKLPEGYSLQTLDYVPNVYVTMQYFTRSLCNPNVPYSPDEGVIEVVEAPLSHVSNAISGEEYVRREMAKYEANNFNATSFSFQDGRMLAVGYDTGTNYNAHLWAVDDKTETIVKIEARSNQTSLQQLAMIAESLKE